MIQLEITSKAIKKLKELISLQQHGVYLRIGVVGGGCSGLNYSIKAVSDKNDDDTLLTIDDLNVIIDPKSATFLDGLTIDYSTNLNSIGYVFSNPNAKQSCSCGMSFGI